MPNNFIITFAVISSVETIVIIIGNAFTIFVFWSRRLSLRRTCFLLINLAIADLIVGITEPIVLATEEFPNSKAVRAQEGERIENHSSAIQHIGGSTSVFFLALISLERVSAVLWPLRHRVMHTRVYVYSIIIVWALGLCTSGLLISSRNYATVDRVYFTVTLTSFLLISLIVICASYLTIRTRLRHTPPGLEVHNRQSTEHNLRLSRTFFIIVALSLLFWLPGFVVYTVRAFCPPCVSPIWMWIVKTFHLANSLVNPFVYSFRMPIFKEALKRFWRKRRQNKELKPGHHSGISKRGSFTLQMGHRVNTPDIALTGYRHTDSSL